MRWSKVSSWGTSILRVVVMVALKMGLLRLRRGTELLNREDEEQGQIITCLRCNKKQWKLRKNFS